MRGIEDVLPASLAFLSGHGVPPGVLLGAATAARRLNVSGEAALITSGEISEDFYYRALAMHVGAQYDVGKGEISGDAQFPQAIIAGVAPLSEPDCGPRWLFAPRGANLDAMLELSRRGRLPRDQIAITTPTSLSFRVREKSASKVALLASASLGRLDPSLSARTPATLPQTIAGASFGFFLPIGLVFGGPVWSLICTICGLLLTGGILLRLFATAVSEESAVNCKTSPLSDFDLPVYTIAVALYREEAVVADLVRSLELIDYPRAKLDIKLIVEADDIGTQDAISQLDLPPYYEMIEVPVGTPRTKPRALNTSLPLARGSLLVVFDAEDRPDPQQLRRAAERFKAATPRLACLQGSLVIDNVDDTWLTRLFAIEYAALFDVLIPGLAQFGVPLPLGGTSNHFRVDALHNVAGWDAWNVTEDIDLGIRLARAGYGISSLPVATDEEAPAHLSAWLRQRRRWMKGWIQTMLTHSRNPARLYRELGPWRTFASCSLIAGGVLGPLLGPVFGFFTLLDAIYGDLLSPMSALAVLGSASWIFIGFTGVVSAMWPALLGMKRRGLLAHAKWLPLLPAYYCLQTFAAWGALLEFFRDPYSWAKTQHGLAAHVAKELAATRQRCSRSNANDTAMRLAQAQAYFPA